MSSSPFTPIALFSLSHTHREKAKLQVPSDRAHCPVTQRVKRIPHQLSKKVHNCFWTRDDFSPLGVLEDKPNGNEQNFLL